MNARRLLLLCFAAVTCLRAQQDGSRVLGNVTDPSGKSVPGAIVRLLGASEQRETFTTSDGLFAFFQVPAGRYRVQADAAGFAKVQSEEIRVEVQTPVSIDLRLPLGERRDTITVSDSRSLLNRVDATQGHAFDSVRLRSCLSKAGM